jgi:hypothetical protein
VAARAPRRLEDHTKAGTQFVAPHTRATHTHARACARAHNHWATAWRARVPQALNYEAGRFFEVYHSSRESFTFLKHFYVGEIRAEDRCLVIPLPPPLASSSEDEDEVCVCVCVCVPRVSPSHSFFTQD